jgi:amino acid transporter
MLSVWDTVSLIIGIVVGVGIYETPPLVFRNVNGPWIGLGAWALGGVLCLIGAFCYAELASTYPHSGGDYVYLSRAYHPWVGFLFGWAQLVIIGTGNIGMMAYVFGDYAVRLWHLERAQSTWFAMSAVTVLTFLNILGLVVGKGVQNLLTACKVLGLGGIVLAGLLAPAKDSYIGSVTVSANFGLAMVFVLYTYGGWNDAALVAADQHIGRRNIPLALILGTAAVTLIYVLVNAAYLLGLRFETALNSRAIAADLMELSFTEYGARAISVLIMVSALGAINGMIITRSRVYSTMGEQYWVLGWLSRWHRGLRAPVYSLLFQWLVTLGLILAVGTTLGELAISKIFETLRLGKVEWSGHGGFDTLFMWTNPAFWTFFLLSGVSLFLLRWRDRHLPRVYKVPFYPVFPLIFCGTCVYMLYSATDYAGKTALVPAVLVLSGLLICGLSPRRRSPEEVHKIAR